MKRTIAAAWLAMALSLPAQTSKAPAGPAIKCKGSDTRPCTAKQVESLADAVASAKQQHDVVATVRSVTLASPDGILKCEQTDGKPCTTPQLDAIKLLGADLKLYLNYAK